MKIVLTINWVLITLLSIATGLFKVLQQEADIELFKAIGFSSLATNLLGVIQLIGGILMIRKKSRKAGAYTMIPTFVVASIAVFANEMMVFGFISLVFIAMAYGVVYKER